MNKNTCARRFNVHCSAAKSWLRLKYSNPNLSNNQFLLNN